MEKLPPPSDKVRVASGLGLMAPTSLGVILGPSPGMFWFLPKDSPDTHVLLWGFQVDPSPLNFHSISVKWVHYCLTAQQSASSLQKAPHSVSSTL